MLSCFMVIKNGVNLGYPFIESIESALPLCDEFIVSEGFSSDNTYEVLERRFGSNDKVKLYQDEWRKKSLKGSAVRIALNNARERCKEEYIMEVDANEIIPEVDIDFIKHLPKMYPDKELFNLPYYQIFGSKILFTEEFRYRMGLNKRAIRVLWDGYTMGYKLNLSTLFEKGGLNRLVNRFLTVILEDRIAGGYLPEQSVYLPKPIYKYYSIFPESFFNKMKSKTILQPGRDYDRLLLSKQNNKIFDIWDAYRKTKNYDQFWKDLFELNEELVNSGININKEFKELRIINETDQPEIIQSLFGKERYEP